jgi:hypothetical protein
MEIGVWTGLGSVGFGEKTHLIEKKRHFWFQAQIVR